MLKAIIFDMDGVLVDCEKAVFESINILLDKYNIKLKEENKNKFLGRPFVDQLEIIKKENPNMPKDLSVLEFSKGAFVYELEIMKDKLVPNLAILKLIKQAKERDIKIAVATSSLRYRAETLLKLIGILDKLDLLITSEDVNKNKPDPMIYKETAKKLNILPEYCFAIEDSVNGIESANRANMKSVALITENFKKEDLISANYIFSDFKDLKLKELMNLF